MKKTYLLLALTALTALIITSCSKKKDAPAATFQNVVGTYKITGFNAQAGSININFLDSMPACQRDDEYKFNLDSTYQYIDAGVSCGTNNDYTDKWNLKGSIMTFDDQDFTIKSFSGSQLVLTFTQNAGGISIPYTITLSKQ